MNILEALKSDDGLRITNMYRWLVWNNDSNEFIVYERGYNKKKTITIVNTSIEDVAIEALLNE